MRCMIHGFVTWIVRFETNPISRPEMYGAVNEKVLDSRG
jgi:hypothetical protein